VSLRSRLLLGTALVLVTLAISMAVVARSQHRFLVDQLDTRLVAAGPIVNGPPMWQLPAPVSGERDEESLLSELYLGRLSSDGTLRPIVLGALVKDSPSVSIEQAERGQKPFTADGVESASEFRVLAVQDPRGDYTIIAIPLAEVDDAQSRLTLTLVIAWLVVFVVLSLTTWWMIRLGLRPINQMTETAEAIARGERGRRVGFDAPTTETGRLGHAFNTMLDERDRAEQRLRTFVADASHELRTPLTSVRGYLDLALDNDLPAERLHDSLRRARSESRRMGDLVDDLLLLAQLDQGRNLSVEPVDLSQVVEDAGSDARAVQPARRIEIDDQSSPTADAVVEGDQYRLRQVIAALVHNALVHTPTEAHIRITIRAAAEDVTVEVADNGPGLPSGFEFSVFDRFSRGETSRSRQAGGAGLGLAIARSIVEAHHGTITVSPPAGSGCTFSVRIPRRQPPTAPIGA